VILEFGDPPLASPDLHLVIVPAVRSKSELLKTIAQGLQAPSWFGLNWDALEEGLRDLSWIRAPKVVIYHTAVPNIPEDELRTYLSILEMAGISSKRSNTNSLQAIFPPEARRIVEVVSKS
jgi:hypothetical protein